MPDELTLPRIHKWMKSYTVTPNMLAQAIGYSANHVRYILRGKRRLMPEAQEKVINYFTERKQELQRQQAAMKELDRCA